MKLYQDAVGRGIPLSDTFRNYVLPNVPPHMNLIAVCVAAVATVEAAYVCKTLLRGAWRRQGQVVTRETASNKSNEEAHRSSALPCAEVVELLRALAEDVDSRHGSAAQLSSAWQGMNATGPGLEEAVLLSWNAICAGRLSKGSCTLQFESSQRDVEAVLRRYIAAASQPNVARDESSRSSSEQLVALQRCCVFMLCLIQRRDAIRALHSSIRVVENASEASLQWEAFRESAHNIVMRRSRSLANPFQFLRGSTSCAYCTVADTLDDLTRLELHGIRDVYHQQEAQLSTLNVQFHILKRNVSVALLKYLYFSSPAKSMSLLVTSLVAGVAAKLTLSGFWLQQRCRQLLDEAPNATAAGDAPSWSNAHNSLRPLVVILGIESLRMVTATIVRRMGEQFIAMQSSHKRELEKLALYRNLVRQPLAFFDLHDYDELEEVVLYVNDLEGVDVHILTYVACLQEATWKLLQCATAAASAPAGRGVALAALACGGLCVKYTAAAINVLVSRVCDTFAAAFASHEHSRFERVEDLEELENAASSSDGFLSGMAILGSIHSLRPYGADLVLMGGWCSRLEDLIAARCGSGSETVGGKCGAPTRLKRRLMVYVRQQGRMWSRVVSSLPISLRTWAATLPVIAQWAVPLVIRHLEASDADRSCGSAVDIMCALEDMIAAVADTRRIFALLLHNGHKAWVLQRLLSTEDEPRDADANAALPYSSLRMVSFRLNRIAFAYPTKHGETVMVEKEESVGSWMEGRPDVDDACEGRRVVLRTSSPMVFDGLDSQKIIGVAGPSGSGKSTLLALLLKLYQPHDGSHLRGSIRVTMRHKSIHADDDNRVVEVDLNDIPSRILRGSFFGFVPQHPQIFYGTIAQNISLHQTVSILSSRDVLERVQQCCESAQCWEFVKSLPEGMLTRIAPPGTSGAAGGGYTVLSGGQAQRLMIARALFTNCQCLLMDEPTASLDGATKRSLLHDLKALLRQSSSSRGGGLSSIICVSHDDFLLEAADVVINIPISSDQK